MEEKDDNQQYWINTVSSVETNEIPATTEEYRIETPKKKITIYSKREARSIAYRYLRCKMGFRVGMFILTPLFVIDTIASLIITIIYKLNALAIAAGIMGIIGIVVIVPCAIYSYKEYKREERRLIRKYGKDFVKNASFFVD